MRVDSVVHVRVRGLVFITVQNKSQEKKDNLT